VPDPVDRRAPRRTHVDAGVRQGSGRGSSPIVERSSYRSAKVS
jgi:hypothetical protein